MIVFFCVFRVLSSMILAALLSDFSSTATQGVWVGIAVGIGVLFFFSRRREPSFDQPILLLNQKPVDPGIQESLDKWNDPKLSSDERRAQARREGHFTP